MTHSLNWTLLILLFFLSLLPEKLMFLPYHTFMADSFWAAQLWSYNQIGPVRVPDVAKDYIETV